MEICKVEGVVARGNALGRRLGYPTANIYGVDTLAAADGVYAVTARLEGIDTPLEGMANLGYRPTVDRGGRRRVLEFHLFDFTGDLYGRRVTVTLCKYLRGEMAFEDTDRLRSRIEEDEKCIRAYFTRTENR